MQTKGKWAYLPISQFTHSNQLPRGEVLKYTKGSESPLGNVTGNEVEGLSAFSRMDSFKVMWVKTGGGGAIVVQLSLR
uniref:Uncharacterized protein n=1 Tax=Fagus sylvatica TaxID=28930 RepID=A0A2N9EJN6_FAGSY